MNILERIQGHEDLVRLSQVEQAQLCDELRQFLVSNVAQTGGHLASNLGVVELSVALETVFDTKVDSLVFDVGRQSYIHKILTEFINIRLGCLFIKIYNILFVIQIIFLQLNLG